MKPHIFEKTVVIERSRDEIFDFFKQAENLQKLTPHWLDFKILTPLPIKMEEGARIDYQLKLMGIPITWRTVTSEWEPPHKFVDVQLSGPYRVWRHTHSFEETPEGTLMRDRVEYLPKGGPLAPLISQLFVRKRIEEIFRYRNREIMRVFPGPGERAAVGER